MEPAACLPLSTPGRQRVVQIAYHVPDLDKAVAAFHCRFGVGPFLVRRRIALGEVRYRGTPAALAISVAHAQWGPVQLELVTQHDNRPSAFRDAFPPDAEGLHHVAIAPEDHAAMVAHYAAQGFPVVTELVTPEGRGAAYVDARPALGHMVEIYRVNPSLHALYARVSALAAQWDGAALVVEE